MRVLVPSPRDVPSYDLKPEMSAPEVTARFVEAIQSGDFGFAVLNFANPDMVGHTGSIPAAVKAVETVDACLGRCHAAIEERGGVALVGRPRKRGADAGAGRPAAYGAYDQSGTFCATDTNASLHEGGELADLAPTALVARTAAVLTNDWQKLDHLPRMTGIYSTSFGAPQPDFGVLRKAQRGDERAFNLIVRAYETPVYNYVLRLVGDQALAEDLTQGVFLRVYQGLPKFSLRCRFTTWLFQVTKNRVLDELRANEKGGRARWWGSTTSHRSRCSMLRWSGSRRWTPSGARSTTSTST